MPDFLSPPAAALRDPKAINMASIWIAERGLHCSLKVGVYATHPTMAETRAWGTILADMARNVADSLIADAAVQGSRDDVINSIWNAFHDELSKPAQATAGGFIGGSQT